jgi:hypothetical protein
MAEQVGRQVSVYIRQADLVLWRRAEEFARVRRVPISGLVMLALERYLDEQEDQPPATR